MSSRAIITRRGIPQRAAAASLESSEARQQGFTVEEVMPQGTLISGAESQLMSLEGQGYRVKLFANTHLLQVGTYQIDTEGQAPQLPGKLQVPKRLEATWPHHLVQLIAPPTDEWIRAIEAQGVDVVEPIGAYGLFVLGSPATVEQLRTLHFVAWVGFFQPAYRIAANLQGLSGRINNINVGVYPESEVPSVRQAIMSLGGIIHDEWDQSGKYQDRFGVLIVELDANKVDDLARAPYVRWLEYQSPVLTADDERSAQILAENLNGALPPNTAPVTGYQGALSALGLSGAGVVVGICDSGVDTNNNATLHPDLVGRMSFLSTRPAAPRRPIRTAMARMSRALPSATRQRATLIPTAFCWARALRQPPTSACSTRSIRLAVPAPDLLERLSSRWSPTARRS